MSLDVQPSTPEINGEIVTDSPDTAKTTAEPLKDLGGCAEADPVEDFVTVLTTNDGKLLTKTIYRRADGQLGRRDYDSAFLYRIETVPVTCLAELAKVLDGLSPQSCIVNGKLRDGVDPNSAQRTHVEKPGQSPSLEDAAHWWIPADIDGLDARDADGEFDPVAEPERAVALVLSRLPTEFGDADCWWQLTTSAGFKPGKIHMRLVFWLTRPLTSTEVKAWLDPCIKEHASKKEKVKPDAILDGAIYSPSQPIYAAKPVLEDGIADPVPRRSGIRTFLGAPVFVPKELVTADSKPKAKPAEGPADVIYDDPETLKWAEEVIHKDVAENGAPRSGVGDASDPRFYSLAAVLRDGPCWGHSVSKDMIACLCKAHWQPAFDLAWFQHKLRGMSQQNGPGVGPAGPGRQYGDPARFAEYQKNAPPPPGDDDEPTQEPGQDPPQANPIVYPRPRNAYDIRHNTYPTPRFVWECFLRMGDHNLWTGDAGAGKTTLALNLAVAVAAGIPLLGLKTIPMRVFLLVAENEEGEVRDDLVKIVKDRGLADHVLQRIDILSVKTHDIPGGHRLVKIDDEGAVTRLAFMDHIISTLRSYNEPVLWVVDPLAEFVHFNRMKDEPARAVSTGFLQHLCHLNGHYSVTPLVLDHPSKASMESGAHYAGSTHLKSGFSLFATLLAGNWSKTPEGILQQRELTLQGMRTRGVAEQELKLYRIGDNPSFSLQRAEGLRKADNAHRVFCHVEEKRKAGERCYARNYKGKHGPDAISCALTLPQEYVKEAIEELMATRIYESRKAENSRNSKNRDPGGLVPGDLYSQVEPERRWFRDWLHGFGRTPVDPSETDDGLSEDGRPAF